MKLKYKTVILLSCLVLVLSGCFGKKAAGLFKTGTYTGEGQGRNGAVTVEVNLSSDRVESITVTSSQETEGISDPAVKNIPASIVKNQTLAVDTVSGATYTSRAIIEAVTDCIVQAGADPAQFSKAVEVSQAEENYDVDMVIAGAGAAGLMAAMDAAEAGFDVLVLEKGSSVHVSNFAHIGGTAAVGSDLQKEAGVNIPVESLFDHMIDYTHWSVNAPLLKRCLEVSGGIINTFTDLGMKILVAEDRYNIGFQNVHVFLSPQKESFLEKAVTDKGGQFLFDTAAEKILLENGTAVGLAGHKRDGTSVNVKAKAVFIATGGYLSNPEMCRENLGDINFTNLGSDLNTGDGIKMVLDAGGTKERNFALSLNDITGFNSKAANYLATFMSPDKNFALDFAYAGGLLVNTHGNRFFNEFVLSNEPLAGGGEATLRAGKYYAIIDEAMVKTVEKEGIFSFWGRPDIWSAGQYMYDTPMSKIRSDINAAIKEGWGSKGATLAEAAKPFGLENLESEVERYNELAAVSDDSDFYKPEEFMKEISEGPFYIFEYEPSSWCSFGGVKVDRDLHALNKDNDVIPGLFVGGLDAGSMYSSPYYDIGGTASGLALMSGRVAAQTMAEYIKGY